MERSGSLCSTTSSHSCAIDELQYLSVEEKACLVFLEKAIESQETDEGTRLAHDEPENPPLQKNRSNKIFNSKDGPHCTDPIRTKNYLVPTPFVLANCGPKFLAKPFKDKSFPIQVLKSGLGLQVGKHPDCEFLQDPQSGGDGMKIYTGTAEREHPTHDEVTNAITIETPETENNGCTESKRFSVTLKPKSIPEGTNNCRTDSNSSVRVIPRDARSGNTGGESVRHEALSKLGLLKEENQKRLNVPGLKGESSSQIMSEITSQNPTTQTSGPEFSALLVLQRPLRAPGSGVMVPNMKEEHQEALRKLGLVKK